jgi:hypothetical protein
MHLAAGHLSFQRGGVWVGVRPSTVRSPYLQMNHSETTMCILVMTYTRAAASDYDDWAKTFDNPGWGSADLIPLLQKV